MKFNLNDKEYDTDDITPEARVVVDRVLLANAIGDIINVSHAALSNQLAGMVEAKPDDAVEEVVDI